MLSRLYRIWGREPTSATHQLEFLFSGELTRNLAILSAGPKMPACSEVVYPSLAAKRKRGTAFELSEYRDLESQFRSVQVADKEPIVGVPAAAVAEPAEARVPHAPIAVDETNRDGVVRIAGFDKEEVPVSIGPHTGLLAAFGSFHHFLGLHHSHSVAARNERTAEGRDVHGLFDAWQGPRGFREQPGPRNRECRDDARIGVRLVLLEPVIEVAI